MATAVATAAASLASENQYEAIASEYQESKQLPFRVYAELPTILTLIGDVTGKSVLDLACGEGIYARKLKKLGAGRVVGVDLSPEMIALAEKVAATEAATDCATTEGADAKSGSAIEYHVQDAAALTELGKFDVILASYLLNYATSTDMMRAFVQGMAKNLKPGGRVVGMNDNPWNDVANHEKFRPYGLTKKSATVPRTPGSPVTYTFYPADGTTFSFDNFHHSPEAYEAMFLECGFKSFRWVKPAVTELGVQTMGSSYWDLFRVDPPVIGFEAEL